MRKMMAILHMNNELLKMVVTKLDRIDSRIDAVDVTLARNTASLEEHVRRTNILEDELKPIKAHVQFVGAAGRIAGMVAAGISFFIGVASFLMKWLG